MMETKNKAFLSVLFALFLILCSFANFAAAASSKSDVRIISVKIISAGNSNTYHPGDDIQFQVKLKNYGKQTDMFALSLWVDKYEIFGLGRTSFIKSDAVNSTIAKLAPLNPGIREFACPTRSKYRKMQKAGGMLPMLGLARLATQKSLKNS